MDEVIALSAILGTLLIGAVSPGPSFVLVARTAIAVSRRNGLAAALGMGAGGVVFGSFALLGVHAVLTRVEWLYLALKVTGGAYLLYTAVALWRGAADPISVPGENRRPAAGFGRSFWHALAIQLSNPKTAVFYGSIFAALLPAEPSPWMITILPPLIFLIEVGWYAVVALAFSSERPRTAYLRSKAWIDRFAGLVMGALGIRLAAEAVRAS